VYHLNQAWRPLFRCCVRGTNRSQVCAIVIAGAILAMLLSSDAGAARKFTTADLEGTWNLHGLISGRPKDFQSWIYGTMTCDANGNSIWRATNHTGETNQSNATLETSGEGIITAREISAHGSAFHGAMRNNKDTIVFTMNDGGGGCNLGVCTRTAGTFTTADFEGTWVCHGLISGNQPGQVPGWYYYSMTADKFGNAQFSTIVDSEGNKHYTVRPSQFSVAANGVVSLYDPQGELPFFHGAMNPAKDTIVAVATMAPGSIEDIRGFNLLIGEKQVPGAYGTSDLTGTWYGYGLVSGSTYNQWTGWYHFTSVVDSQGKSSIVPGSYLNSHGETEQAGTSLMSMTSDGIITMPSPVGFHGILGIGKDISVATMYDGGGGYGLSISVGRRGDRFDFDGDVDFVLLLVGILVSCANLLRWYLVKLL